jgi:polar amino acid transport system substrate-binding protein
VCRAAYRARVAQENVAGMSDAGIIDHMKRIFVAILLCTCLFGAVPASAQFPVVGPVDTAESAPAIPVKDPTQGPLTVVTHIVQPFVVDKTNDPNALCADSPVLAGQNGKQFCGYSQELLQLLSQQLGREVAPQALDKTADDIVADMSGDSPKYDMAIGNMSITSEREKLVDFSVPLPIINSGIQIMTPAPDAQRPHLFHNAIAALTSTGAKQFYPILVLILLLMLATAVVVYVIERRYKNSFLYGQPWVKGVAEAFWWILTVIFGQEEAHPRRLLSRIIAFIWIPFGVICVSLFTASVTASLTAQQIQNTIQGVDDLRTKHVLTVSGSTSKRYLDDHDIKAQVVDTINQAYPLLENGTADAIVYDAPALQYYADHDGKGRVVTVGKLLKRESYALVFANGSPLREQVNQALLRLQDDGTIDRLNQKWFEEK